jgi:hypothetical protein
MGNQPKEIKMNYITIVRAKLRAIKEAQMAHDATVEKLSVTRPMGRLDTSRI